MVIVLLSRSDGSYLAMLCYYAMVCYAMTCYAIRCYAMRCELIRLHIHISVCMRAVSDRHRNIVACMRAVGDRRRHIVECMSAVSDRHTRAAGDDSMFIEPLIFASGLL